MSKTLLNPQQSADVVGVTRPGFVKMFKRGDIKAELTVGRQSFFSRKSVAALKRRIEGKKNGRRKK